MVTAAVRALLGLIALAFAGCTCVWRERVPPQVTEIEALVERSTMLRVGCLDANGDGRVNAGDAGAQALPDLTGDGVADDADRAVVRRLDLAFPEGRPVGCAGGAPEPDWQVTPLPQPGCGVGKGGLIVLGVGGGTNTLASTEDAAGVRWMLEEIGGALAERGVAHQLASVAPALNGSARPQPDAEAWSTAYLSAQLERAPCLRVALLGHSHGGAHVAAVTARLEDAGLGDRVLFTVLVDRVTALYMGDARAMPRSVPVFNIYQTNDETLRGARLDGSNIENWDASNILGPEEGHQGGELRPVNHVTIDNSAAVLGAIRTRLLLRACAAALCK